MTTYRINLHTRCPLVFSRVALNAKGRELERTLTFHNTMESAKSLIGFGATEVIVTPAARRAEMESQT